MDKYINLLLNFDVENYNSRLLSIRLLLLIKATNSEDVKLVNRLLQLLYSYPTGVIEYRKILLDLQNIIDE